MLQEANRYSDRTELRGEKLHAAFNSLLKCFSHARDHAVFVNQPNLRLSHHHSGSKRLSAAASLELKAPLAWVLEELDLGCWSSFRGLDRSD